MLGVAPIQKPDAYIHFAPKEPMELKYCVSISASRKLRASSIHFLSNEQMHFGFAVGLTATVDSSKAGLIVESHGIFAAGGFGHSGYPKVLAKNLGFLRVFSSGILDDSGSRPTLDGFQRLPHLIAPFGTAPVQLQINKSSQVHWKNEQVLWEYSGPASIRGVGVYQVTCVGVAGNMHYGKLRFQCRFWLRISDSSVERVEMITPPTDNNLGGYKFVMSRIR